MKVKLKLFFKWGIEFNKDKPYTVEDNGGREVVYAEKKEIMDGIVQKYHPEWLIKEEMPKDGESVGGNIGGENQTESQSNEPQHTPPSKPKSKNNGNGQGAALRTSRQKHSASPKTQEVKSDGQT